MSTDEEPFCGQTLLDIGQYYLKNIRNYADVSICVISVIFNLFNILVFTRKNMISSVNRIFTHLAFVDLLIALMTLFITWMRASSAVRSFNDFTYYEAAFVMYAGNLKVILLLMSAFLTMMLAVWRYIAVVHPLRERDWCNMKITSIVLMAVYFTCILISISRYLSIELIASSDKKGTHYHPIYKRNSILPTVELIIRGTLQYLLPAVVLPILGFRLIVVLLARKVSRRRPTSCSSIQNNTRNLEMKRRTDRSIITMLIVISLFTITNIPAGVFELVSSYYSMKTRIHKKCFSGIPGIIFLFTYINTAITFLVYYTMSKDFRTTFKSMFNRKNSSSREEIHV